MPLLTPDDRDALLGPLAFVCKDCGVRCIRHYCRSCDEFFWSCHCSRPEETAHLPHRVYLWTPSGIVARPNFDQ